MGVVFDMTKAFLDSRGMRYQVLEEGAVIRTGIGGLDNKGTMEVIVFFDENDRTISLKSFDLCQIPEEKKEAVYGVCNELNMSFRWLKFYVDEGDNTVTAQDDAIVQPDSSGEEILALIARMAGVIDEAYPKLMKILWN